MQITAANLAYLLYCASIVAAAPVQQQKRATSTYTGGSTANDIDNGVCAPITLLFARGSTEIGNMGSTVGPALAKAIKSASGGDVAVQGVDYAASIASNISLGSEGGPEMAKLGEKAVQQCPDTKLILGGYSQGATVTHYAVGNRGGLSADSVAAAVLYGDPEYHASSVGNLPDSKVKEFCATGDGVCETGTFAITAAHLSYGISSDIKQGAEFAVQQAGTSSGSSASTTDSSSATGTDSTDSTGTSSGSGLEGLLGGLGGSSSDSDSSSGFGSLLSNLEGGSSTSSAVPATSSASATTGTDDSGSSEEGGLASLIGSDLSSLKADSSVGASGLFPSKAMGIGGIALPTGLPSLGSLGGSSSSGSSGFPSLPQLGGSSSGSSFPSLSGLGGSSSSGGFPSLGGSGSALPTGLPSLGSLGGDSSSGGLSGLLGSLGSASPSGLPSLGSSSGSASSYGSDSSSSGSAAMPFKA